MIRKMKALGLALVAAFALSAVAASAATAQTEGHFYSHSINGKTHMHGQQVGESNPLTLTTEEGEPFYTFECPNEGTTFTGTMEESTATAAAVHPTYAGHEEACAIKYNEEFVEKVEIDAEGCDYILGTNTDAKKHAPVQIVCEPEKEITTTDPFGCEIHIPPQTPEGGVHYTNEGETGPEIIFEEFEVTTEAITARVTLTGIEYTVTPEPCLHPPGGSADYDTTITIRGYEDQADEEGPTTGPQVSIAWTETE